MLSRGELAPDFELPNQDGDPVALSDYSGERVVLYFYPRADTRGCTIEAKDFRDHWDAFVDADVTVLGISNDPVEDLAAFAEKYDLPFELLSDEDGAVASAYETYGTVEIDGETNEIALRNTYVIAPDGTIERVYEDVSPDGHAKEILADL
ncbi:MAG: peroxiredoxin [Halobacteriales archaeon]|nr:peroxiredoxin [Halobacteriales archaeon]